VPVNSRGLAVAWAALTALAARTSQTPGTPAFEFTLPTLSGDSATLSAYRGHPLILTFWATWCVPCRADLRQLGDVYRDHAAQGLTILAVDLADQERLKDVRAFVRDAPLPFPVLLDRRGHVWPRYARRGVPTSVFIDTAGVVRFVVPGPVTPETVRRGLVAILPSP
jgi:peroxiredoxin